MGTLRDCKIRPLLAPDCRIYLDSSNGQSNIYCWSKQPVKYSKTPNAYEVKGIFAIVAILMDFNPFSVRKGQL